jgi:hypothetical protein
MRLDIYTKCENAYLYPLALCLPLFVSAVFSAERGTLGPRVLCNGISEAGAAERVQGA